jgi:hypothetical protein
MSDKEILEARITRDQMAEAVARSGYLLEQRVFPTIEKAGFYVETNPVFADPVTGKSREYDFSALTEIKLYREDWDFLWIHLIGECVNNSQPIVFFSAAGIVDFLCVQDLKCSGIPLKFPWPQEKDAEMSFQDFFHLDKFHHYCHGPYSTQYCSFHHKSGKSEWLAWHDEEHHSLFDTLALATEYEMGESFSSWVLPEKDEEEPFNLNLFYPLLIIKNELYECKQKKGKPVFTRREHIQFRKSVVLAGKQETFHIDVITEAHLTNYLKLLEQEHEKLATRMRRKKKEVRAAIGGIVSQARAARRKGKRKDFRDVLEF